MSEGLANLLAAIMLAFTSYISCKKMLNIKEKTNINNIAWVLLLSITTFALKETKYTGTYTILVAILNIITIKVIFKISLQESILLMGIFLLNLFLVDTAVSGVICSFLPLEMIVTEPLIIIPANLIICTLVVILYEIKKLREAYQKFYNNVRTKKPILNIIFIILMTIGFSFLAYSITTSHSWDKDYIINNISMIIIVIVVLIYIKEKNDNKKLMDEYDTLFSYIQTFEDWIETEQLNRHEYKNQLAVLREMTNNKKIIKKIDEILEDTINVKGETINQLKNLPSGGLKGLIYYKSTIANRNKIDLTINVTLKRNNMLAKLENDETKTLCKLIGIYLDNALEAALETVSKKVLIEIYELSEVTKIVISNTYNNIIDIDLIDMKGYTTKGKNHGNGLYFASKMLSKNKWIEESKKQIDNYYIQEIIIKNK